MNGCTSAEKMRLVQQSVGRRDSLRATRILSSICSHYYEQEYMLFLNASHTAHKRAILWKPEVKLHSSCRTLFYGLRCLIMCWFPCFYLMLNYVLLLWECAHFISQVYIPFCISLHNYVTMQVPYIESGVRFAFLKLDFELFLARD